MSYTCKHNHNNWKRKKKKYKSNICWKRSISQRQNLQTKTVQTNKGEVSIQNKKQTSYDLITSISNPSEQLIGSNKSKKESPLPPWNHKGSIAERRNSPGIRAPANKNVNEFRFRPLRVRSELELPTRAFEGRLTTTNEDRGRGILWVPPKIIFKTL